MLITALPCDVELGTQENKNVSFPCMHVHARRTWEYHMSKYTGRECWMHKAQYLGGKSFYQLCGLCSVSLNGGTVKASKASCALLSFA